MSADHEGLSARAFLITAMLLWMPFGLYAALASDDGLIRFFPDDAFYYLQPAVNFVLHGFPTFDGVHFTNGFHPLNFLLSSTLATVLSKGALLRAVFAIDMALVVSAFAWIVRQRADILSPSLQVFLSSAITLPIVTGFLTLSAGMESALLAFCIAALLAAWKNAENSRFTTLGPNLRFGFVIGATVLARLDIAIALLPLSLYLVVQATDRMRALRLNELAQLAIVLLVAAVLVALYLFVNLATTGHLLPISGYVKQLAVGGDHTWEPSTRGTVLGLALTLLPAVVSVVVVARSARTGEIGSPVALLNVGNLLFYAYLLSGVAQVFRWYYAFPLTCLAINIVDSSAAVRSFGGPVSNLFRARTFASLAVGLAVAANAAFLLGVGRREESVSYQLKKVSELVNRYGGGHSVNGVQDAGIIGYFASGRVINLDGLANDYDYVDNYLRQRRVGEYLRREAATHVLVRDGTLVNADEVAQGTYLTARSALDPTLAWAKNDELFRYQLPGQFTVYYFRSAR